MQPVVLTHRWSCRVRHSLTTNDRNPLKFESAAAGIANSLFVFYAEFHDVLGMQRVSRILEAARCSLLNRFVLPADSAGTRSTLERQQQTEFATSSRSARRARSSSWRHQTPPPIVCAKSACLEGRAFVFTVQNSQPAANRLA
jgi:hypothetical protein